MTAARARSRAATGARVVAVAAVVAVAVAACSGGDAAAPPPASPTTAPGTTAPATVGGMPVVALHGSFTYGSAVGTLGGLVHDVAHGRAWLAMRVRNDGDQTVQWGADVALVDAAGSHPGSIEGAMPDLQVGIPLDVTYRIENLRELDPAASEVVVGAAARQRQVMPQGPAAPDAEQVAFARSFPLTGGLRIDRWVVTFTGGELLPGRPDGIPADAGQQFLRVRYDLGALAKGGAFGYGPGDNVTVRLPDGREVEAVVDSGPIGPLGRTTSSGLWAVYPVPRAPSGPLRLVLADRGHHTLSSDPPRTTDMELRLPDGGGAPPDLGVPPLPRPPRLDADGNLDRTPPPPPDPLAPADALFVYGDFRVVVRRVRVDTERATTTLDVDLTYLGHEETRYLDAPFTLVWGHDAASGGPTKHPTLAPGERGTDTVELRGRVPDADGLHRAFLVVGRGSENRSVLPIGPDAAVAANRMVVVDHPQQGAVSVGAWGVEVLGAQTGSLDATARGPKADTTVLEVHVRVRVLAENRDGFGGTGQLLLRSPDGATVSPRWASASLAVHDVGASAEGWVQYQVPEPHGPGYQLVLRGRDEADLGVREYDEAAVPLAF